MFNTAFDRVIGHEGGFQNDKKDRGNWTTGEVGKGLCKGTKFGISAMSYPELDIQNLTVNQAKDIYKRDWWNKYKLDNFHPAIAYQLFDAGINHGMKTAIKFLQRSVGVDDDGIVGPKTMEAVNKLDEVEIAIGFLAARLQYFTEVKTWNEYGKGWARRVVTNLKYVPEDIK